MKFLEPKNIDDDLLTLISQTRTRIKTLENNFKNEQDPRLINSYIYELQALEARYSYYISLSKNDSQSVSVL